MAMPKAQRIQQSITTKINQLKKQNTLTPKDFDYLYKRTHELYDLAREVDKQSSRKSNLTGNEEIYEMKNDIKRIGDAILSHIRFVIRETSKGDTDFEFKLNRWVFSRLLSDSRKQSKPVKQKLWDSGMQSCQDCGKKFSSIKGFEIHRKNEALGYSIENCDLLCRPCHQKPGNKQSNRTGNEKTL